MNNFHHLTKLTVSILMLSLLAGCLSVERKKPFEELEAFRSEKVDPSTINLWPFYLHSNDSSSYLWPLVKTAPNHLAIRPLYNYDQGANDLLLGIASWDLGRREYRLAPIYWYFPERKLFAAAPLWYQSLSGDTHAMGSPLLYNRIWAPDTGNTFWNATLAWGATDISDGKAYHSYGVFPLWFHLANRWKTYDIGFPLYWYSRDNRTSNSYLQALILYHQFAEKDSFSNFVFPIWWYSSRKDNYSATFFPLYHQYGDKNSFTNWLLPVWYRDRDKDSSKTWALLYYGGHDGDHYYDALFPFYLRLYDPDASAFATPLYGWGKNRERCYTYILNSGTYSTPRYSSWWSLPFYFGQTEDTTPEADDPETAPEGIPYYQPTRKTSHWTLLGGTSSHTTGTLTDRRSIWLSPFFTPWQYTSTPTSSELTIFPVLDTRFERDVVSGISKSKVDLLLGWLYRSDCATYSELNLRNYSYNAFFNLFGCGHTDTRYASDDRITLDNTTWWRTPVIEHTYAPTLTRWGSLGGFLWEYSIKEKVFSSSANKETYFDTSFSILSKIGYKQRHKYIPNDDTFYDNEYSSLLGLLSYEHANYNFYDRKPESSEEYEDLYIRVFGFTHERRVRPRLYYSEETESVFGFLSHSSVYSTAADENPNDRYSKSSYHLLAKLLLDYSSETRIESGLTNVDLDILLFLGYTYHRRGFEREYTDSSSGCDGLDVRYLPKDSLTQSIFFLYQYEHDYSATMRKCSHRFFPLYGFTSEEDLVKQTELRDLFIIPLLYKNHHEKTTTTSLYKNGVFPIYSFESAQNHENQSYTDNLLILPLLYNRHVETTPEQTHIKTSMFPLWRSEASLTATETRSSFDFLFGALIDFQKITPLEATAPTPADRTATSTTNCTRYTTVDFKFLRHLYRYRRDADGATQWYAFPFIESNTQTDGSTASSFLWRVWRKETPANAPTRYHLLFIPFSF